MRQASDRSDRFVEEVRQVFHRALDDGMRPYLLALLLVRVLPELCEYEIAIGHVRGAFMQAELDRIAKVLRPKRGRC